METRWFKTEGFWWTDISFSHSWVKRKKGRSHSKQRKLNSLIIHYEWSYFFSQPRWKSPFLNVISTHETALFKPMPTASEITTANTASYAVISFPEIMCFSLQVKLNWVKWKGLDLINELVYILWTFVAVLPFQSRNTKNFGQDELVKVMQQLR